MKTILITIAILSIVLILTEKVFKQALIRFKQQAKLVEKSANKTKYRKEMIGELPDLDKLIKQEEVK